MIVLDTNVVSEVFRPDPEPAVLAWMAVVEEDLAITTVTAAELLAGIAVLPPGRRRDSLLEATEQVLDDYGIAGLVLPFDTEAAYLFADIVARRRRQGRPIAIADAQIAAICRRAGGSCATRNVADFELTGVRELIDPWAYDSGGAPRLS